MNKKRWKVLSIVVFWCKGSDKPDITFTRIRDDEDGVPEFRVNTYKPRASNDTNRLHIGQLMTFTGCRVDIVITPSLFNVCVYPQEKADAPEE